VVRLNGIVHVDMTEMELSQCRKVEVREDAALVADFVKEEGVQSRKGNCRWWCVEGVLAIGKAMEVQVFQVGAMCEKTEEVWRANTVFVWSLRDVERCE
jgi:hypothetical protein